MLLIGDRIIITRGNHKGELGAIEAYDGFAFYTIKLDKAERAIKCTKEDFEPTTEES